MSFDELWHQRRLAVYDAAFAWTMCYCRDENRAHNDALATQAAWEKKNPPRAGRRTR